jgi:TolB-like protein/class 3 adenylate cyclase
VHRRLAAILFADVAGYSRLMGSDESGTLAALERHVEGVLKPRIRGHGGRIASVAGDGFLAVYPSALEAVTSALEIQADMRDRNRGIEESRKFQFRIGIHLSEVVVRGKGVAGDGVNIAARIQALAVPGEIYVTDSIETQVRGKLEVAFHDLGPHELKNIARPVHILAVTRVGEIPAVQRVVASSKASVAVLPFLNLSSDPESVYFSDGFAEDLITTLSRFRTISVIARNSSFVYRGQNVDVRKVGRELGVQFVVEGSMRRLHDSTRITVQLVDAVSSHHVWADNYDVPSDHVFAIQDDIIRGVVGRLVPRMEEEGLEIARRRPTEQPEAYYQYLRGKSLLYDEVDAQKFDLARTHLERAVQLDPTFAAAYCYLAMIYNTLTMYLSPGEPVATYRERAWDYAKRAAEFDDAHAHTHTTLAWCHLWRGEFDIARRTWHGPRRSTPMMPIRRSSAAWRWSISARWRTRSRASKWPFALIRSTPTIISPTLAKPITSLGAITT